MQYICIYIRVGDTLQNHFCQRWCFWMTLASYQNLGHCSASLLYMYFTYISVLTCIYMVSVVVVYIYTFMQIHTYTYVCLYIFMYVYMLFKHLFKINEYLFHLGIISYNNVSLRIMNFWLLAEQFFSPVSACFVVAAQALTQRGLLQEGATADSGVWASLPSEGQGVTAVCSGRGTHLLQT